MIGTARSIISDVETRFVQTYDILMSGILIAAMIFGAIKGFAWQLASIASIVLSYAVAYHYREPVSQNIQWERPWNGFLAMLILYVGTSLLIWMTLRMVGSVIDRMKLKEFDRQIGALFGLIKGGLVCVVITLFAVTLLGDTVRESIVSSRSGGWIAQMLDESDAIIPPELNAVVHPALDRFRNRLGNATGIAPELGVGSTPNWMTAELPARSSSPATSPWYAPTPAATPSTTPWSPPTQTPWQVSR